MTAGAPPGRAGRRAPREFGEYLRGFVLQHESDKIAYAELCLSDECDAPNDWRRDVEEYIEQTRRALAEPDFDIPFDMREKWSPENARALIQRLVLEYGRLLEAWPALVVAAAAASPVSSWPEPSARTLRACLRAGR